MPPLRNSADSYVAELRNFGTAAERINDLVRVHDTNLSALRPLNASTLRGCAPSISGMSTLHERLLEICRDQGIASPKGTDIQRIAKITSGRVTQIKQERGAARLGDETAAHLHRLGYALDWIREGKGPKRVLPSPNTTGIQSQLHSDVSPGPDVRGRVPLISWVQAGMWNEAIDIYEPGYAEEWLPIIQNGGNHAYALRVEGDSMTSTHGRSYPEGTIVIVNPDQRAPATGQRIIARLRGSARVTFKQYVEEDGRRWLKPLNPMHPPIYDEFEVLGTVIATYAID